MIFNEENYPELPKNWEVIKVIDAQENITNFEKTQSNAYLDSGFLAIIDQGASLIGGFTNELSKAIKSG